MQLENMTSRPLPVMLAGRRTITLPPYGRGVITASESKSSHLQTLLSHSPPCVRVCQDAPAPAKPTTAPPVATDAKPSPTAEEEVVTEAISPKPSTSRAGRRTRRKSPKRRAD